MTVHHNEPDNFIDDPEEFSHCCTWLLHEHKGKNIMVHQQSCLGHCGGQSWDLSSLLVMGSCGQYLDEFFIIIIVLLQWLRYHSNIQKIVLLSIFYVVVVMCINNMSVIIAIVHSIDVVVWVFKYTAFTLGLWQEIVAFGRFWYLGINILVGVLGYWPMFMIVLKDMFSYWLILDEQWELERACFQFYIMLH